MATRGPDPTNKTQQIVGTLQDYERPFAGTGELADELGYSSNPGVQKHLQRAVNEGAIEKTSISGYNIWYLPGLVQESQIDTSGPAPGGSAGGGEPPQEQIDRSAQLQDTTGILGKVKQGLRSRYNHHPVITGSIGFGFVLALLSFAGLSGTVVLQPQALGLMLLFLASYLVGFTVAASAAIWLLFKQAKVWQEQPTTGTTPSESTLEQ